MDLVEILLEYKDLTIKMIESIKGDTEIDELIKKRSKILEKISILSFDKNEVKNTVKSLGIMELENELHDLIRIAKNDVKNQLIKLQQLKVANDRYINFKSGAHIFSTKI